MTFPDEISTPFLFEGEAYYRGKSMISTKRTSDDSVNKAAKFANNIKEHIKTHYNIYASQALKTPDVAPADTFSTVDALYYHVYGDYRLTMFAPPTEDAPEFLKSSSSVLPSTVYRYISAPPQKVANLKTATNGNFFKPYLDAEADNKDKLKGALTDGLSTEQTATEWFQRELAFGSSANKFHLPSLGTLALTSVGLGGTFNEVISAAISMVEKLATFTLEERDSAALPDFLNDPFDATTIGVVNPKSDIKLIHSIHEAIIDHPEYQDLATNYPGGVPTEASLLDACKEFYLQSDLVEGVQEYIVSVLDAASLKFGVGMPVRVPAAKAAAIATANGLTTTEVTESAWIVIAAMPIPGQKAAQGEFTISAEISGVEQVIGPLKHSDLEVRVVTLEDEAILERAGSKKQPLTNPVTLTFFRIFLDILFTFEAVIYAANIKYQPRRIDNSIHRDDNVELQAAEYRNMSYVLGSTADSPFTKNQIKDSPGTMETFATLRTTHTLANIANLDSLSKGFDMEGFYKEDLRLSEVLWLAQALTDEGKAVLERKETPNLLAQVRYTAKGVGEGVSAEAPINAKTVFYQMDSPILKDVIMKYDQLFIDFTITNAFALSKNQQKKVAGGEDVEPNADLIKLTSAIWGSIAGRSSDILNRQGVEPHLIFKRLFNQMEALSGSLYGVVDLYPPKWTGTNTVTRVSRSPLELGENIDMKFYSDCMTEYIKHLKNNFSAQPAVARAVLTILGDIVIQAEGNIDNLRESFIARIKSQAKRGMLKGTSIRFDAYRAVMCVMRSEIDIPLQFREAFVAQKLDEEQRRQIKDTFSTDSKPYILPETHPEFKEVTAQEGDSESALFGLENPNFLPQPAFYPKAGSILNRGNKKVEDYLTSVIGIADKTTYPGFPDGRFQAYFSATLSADEIEDLKAHLLHPDTRFIVQEIDWKGETKIWDGRDNKGQPAHPSVVAHYRDNLGVILSAERKGYPPIELDFIPKKDLTDYDHLLYKKYHTDRLDKANYIYIPPGEVFRNPNEYHYFRPGDPSLGIMPVALPPEDDPYKVTGDYGDTVMVYRGEDVAELVASLSPTPAPPKKSPEPYEHQPIVDMIDNLDTRVWNHKNETVEATDKNTAELAKIATAVDGAGSKFADAGASFEKASEAFERAGEKFTEAGRYYENAANAFAEIPEALKVALTEASINFLDEIENRFDTPIEDFDPIEDPEVGEIAIQVVEEMDTLGQAPIEGGLEAIQNIGLMLPERAYMYRNFTTHLQDMYVDDRSSDNFLSAPANKKTGKQVRSWVSHSLGVALAAYPSDNQITDEVANNLSPDAYKALLWRKHCISVILFMIEGKYEQARLELGIEDFQKEEVEVEEAEDDEPGFIESQIEKGKEALEEVGGVKGAISKVKEALT